jgi:hypothetical protein
MGHVQAQLGLTVAMLRGRQPAWSVKAKDSRTRDGIELSGLKWEQRRQSVYAKPPRCHRLIGQQIIRGKSGTIDEGTKVAVRPDLRACQAVQ